MGVALVSDLSDLSDQSDLSDKKGAPVFALTGYAVASHVIPCGFAVPLSGMARVQSYRGGMQRSALPQGKSNKKNPAARLKRVRRRAHETVCGGFLRGSPLKRLQQRRNRYPLFFAKLFFLS